jgi:hypothetical protein
LTSRKSFFQFKSIRRRGRGAAICFFLVFTIHRISPGPKEKQIPETRNPEGRPPGRPDLQRSSPVGTEQRSPPFQRWECVRKKESPVGAAQDEPQPCAAPTGLFAISMHVPTVETVGYVVPSLRDFQGTEIIRYAAAVEWAWPVANFSAAAITAASSPNPGSQWTRGSLRNQVSWRLA